MHHHVCLCCFSHVRRKLAVKMVCKSAHFHIRFFTPRTLLNACCYCVKKKKKPTPVKQMVCSVIGGTPDQTPYPSFLFIPLESPFLFPQFLSCEGNAFSTKASKLRCLCFTNTRYASPLGLISDLTL